MFSRSSNAAPAARPKGPRGAPGLSFIGAEVVISGDVATSAQLHVEGRIDGHVRCGALCQGATGIIAGDLVADEARIAGLVEGTVSARLLVIEASGRVTGDVAYETISIAAGARVDGRLARAAALEGGGGAEMLVATSTEDAAGAEAATLFSGAPTRIAAE